MSNAHPLRPLADLPDGNSDPTGEDSPELHALLRAQLKEARQRGSSTKPDLGILLRLLSAHYDAIDQERRGIVQSMRLMADEARAMAHEAREQSSEHLQVILDRTTTGVTRPATEHCPRPKATTSCTWTTTMSTSPGRFSGPRRRPAGATPR